MTTTTVQEFAARLATMTVTPRPLVADSLVLSTNVLDLTTAPAPLATLWRWPTLSPVDLALLDLLAASDPLAAPPVVMASSAGTPNGDLESPAVSVIGGDSGELPSYISIRFDLPSAPAESLSMPPEVVPVPLPIVLAGAGLAAAAFLRRRLTRR